jgi:nucleotide-binding universal stress UspA family protein
MLDVTGLKKARIELLGIGSAKNRELKANLLEALRQLSLEDLPIVEVQDIERLLRYDISGIPALVVNGKVVFEKTVPSVEDLKIMLGVLLPAGESAKPLRQILAPVDFSDTSENAVRYALELAARIGADMEIAHVWQERSEWIAPLHLENNRNDLAYKSRLLQTLKEQVERQRNQDPGLAGVKVITALLKGGAGDQIVHLSRRPQTGMIVMGSAGDSGRLHRWMGSVAALVARRAHCPVLLIPPDARFRPYRDIVYASNYLPNEGTLLPGLVDFASLFGATVHFVHVRTDHNLPHSNVKNDDARLIRQNGITFPVATIDSADVVGGLNNFRRAVNADLLVMAASRRGFLEEVFHQSAIQQMILKAAGPLMVLHC